MRLASSIVIFFLPLVFAIDFQVPNNLTSGGPATISWSSTDADPDFFSIELINTVFNNAFAIANNVQKTLGRISITLPVVPAGAGYTIEAVDVGNINLVFGTSGSFSIGETVTTTSSTSTSSSISGTLSSGSVTTPAGSTSTSFTVTPTRPSGSSGSSSSTSSSPSSSASSFNGSGNGASGRNIGSGTGGSIAAAVVGVIAGAVFI